MDATNPTPWLNKSAFQVRKATMKKVIGTEEGNMLQTFVNELESMQQLQTSLSASIPVSQLVSIGMDSELSRSYSTSHKSKGKKIITRTISFRADFDDTDDKEETFESQLNEWISTEELWSNDNAILVSEILNQDELTNYCYKFVKTFSITHYVHSLKPVSYTHLTLPTIYSV